LSVKIDEHIWPACLPTRPYYDTKAIVTGFGKTGRGILSQELLKVVVDKFDHQTCKDMYEERYNETTMLCYGHSTENSCIVSLDQGRSQGSALGIQNFFSIS